MQSEWMVEVPTTMATDWLAVPVPEGRRNLVRLQSYFTLMFLTSSTVCTFHGLKFPVLFKIVAGDGKTRQYSRSGAFVNQFPTYLPGGNRTNGSRGDVTILDTIFSPISRTFYVIDCMVWKRNAYYDCDTEFRYKIRVKLLFSFRRNESWKALMLYYTWESITFKYRCTLN